jgi:VanZ family protein
MNGIMTRSLRLAAWSCVTLIGILSLLPAGEMVRTSWGGHVEHVAAYAGTALLIRLGYPDRKVAWIVAALVVYAAVLECLQNFSPGRNPAVGDWLASSSGSLVGSTVAHLVGKVIKRPLFASQT